MVTQMFKSQIRKSVEAYIDDIFVKSKQTSEHFNDLESVFEVFKKDKLLFWC